MRSTIVAETLSAIILDGVPRAFKKLKSLASRTELCNKISLVKRFL